MFVKLYTQTKQNFPLSLDTQKVFSQYINIKLPDQYLSKLKNQI